MRVIMFDAGPTFCSDWARAARYTGEVIEVRAVPAVRHVRRQPVLRALRPDYYLVEMPQGYFDRAARRVGADLQARFWAKAIEEIQLKHGRVDVLHAHFYAGARSLPYLAKRFNIPFVVTEHSTALNGLNPDNVLTKRGLRLARHVYGRASMVLPVSNALSDRIAALGLPGERLVVPNPIDTTLFRPVAIPSRAQGSPHLISVARLARAKRHDVLLHAFRRVVDVDTHARLRIIGSGPLDGELHVLATTLGLERHVQFVGQSDRTDIARALQQSDAFVLASDTENLPVAVTEALCTGLPVVATRVGGLAEQVQHRDGALVEPGAPEAMAEQILRVLREPLEARQERARRASNRYSFATVGAQLSHVYQSISAARAS